MNASDIIESALADGVKVVLLPDGTAEAFGDPAWRDAWIPVFREHKAELLAELHRQRRHAKVLKMLGDGRKYAVLVENDKTDRVIATCAIRGLATFEMAIPKHSYNGMVLLELIAKHSAEAQPSGEATPSPDSQQRNQAHPDRRAA